MINKIAQILEEINSFKAESKEAFSEIAYTIHDELQTYHQLFDIYNDYEGINNLKTINDNAGKDPVKVDKKLIDFLLEAKELYRITNGEMNIINGPDEMLLMGLSAGADGGIGTTYNFMFDIIRGIYDNFVKGDLETAREYQTRAIRIISVLLNYKIIPAAKAVLEAQGYAVGNATFPMKRYSDEEKATIVEQMREAGLKI